MRKLFSAEDAVLDVSCAGTAIVNVDGSLEVDASQNARVYYAGEPASTEIKAHEYAIVDRD